jgi:hypothetical protein
MLAVVVVVIKFEIHAHMLFHLQEIFLRLEDIQQQNLLYIKFIKLIKFKLI